MDHAAALIEQTRLLGELGRGADTSTRVPTCPDWTLRQLLTHVGRGHRWAAAIVRERPGAPIRPRSVPDGRQPSDPAEAMAWLRASAASVLDAVAETGPDTPVWTFLGPRPSAWWVRRRLHEATVHRADAALALGADYLLSPELAADGVSEWLEMVAARASASASPIDPGVRLRLRATDEDGSWLLRGERDGVGLSSGHGEMHGEMHGAATTMVRGRAVDLLLALTRRLPTGKAGLEVVGDAGTWAGWLGRTPY